MILNYCAHFVLGERTQKTSSDKKGYQKWTKVRDTVPDVSMWRPWAGSLLEAPTQG